MQVEEIAKACHEVNRAFCVALGDLSQPAWEVAPDWVRRSALEGVQTVLRDGVTDPAVLHTRWAQSKVREGWVWGPVKDPVGRQHPCLVAFQRLPPEQQAKDQLFLAVVGAFRHLVQDGV